MEVMENSTNSQFQVQISAELRSYLLSTAANSGFGFT